MREKGEEEGKKEEGMGGREGGSKEEVKNGGRERR